MPLKLLAASLALFSLAGCGSDQAPASLTPEVFTGVVVEVDSPELGDVRSFTLRSEGREYKLFVDPDVTYDDFPQPHLNDHLASAEPVRVEVDERGNRLYARAIEDA